MTAADGDNERHSPPPGGRWSFDRLCDEFEAAWQSLHRPKIEAYLGAVAQKERSSLFLELLALEVEYIDATGESFPARPLTSRGLLPTPNTFVKCSPSSAILPALSLRRAPMFVRRTKWRLKERGRWKR